MDALKWSYLPLPASILRNFRPAELEELPGLTIETADAIADSIGGWNTLADESSDIISRPHWEMQTIAASQYYHDKDWPLRPRDSRFVELLWPQLSLRSLAEADLEEWLAAWNRRSLTHGSGFTHSLMSINHLVKAQQILNWQIGGRKLRIVQ